MKISVVKPNGNEVLVQYNQYFATIKMVDGKVEVSYLSSLKIESELSITHYINFLELIRLGIENLKSKED